MTVQKRAAILLLSVALLLGMVACGQGNAADVPSTPSMLSVPGTSQSELLSTERSDLPFTDVPANADYAPAVAWCLEQNLMNGTSATTFAPDSTLTRAMVVTVLYRAEREPQVEWSNTFSDVTAGQWYSNAIIWAGTNGIVAGYGNGLFGPNDPITKEQLDVIIRRYNGETPVWTGNPDLAVPATRAEAAVAFYENLSEKEKKPAADSITTNGGEVISLSSLEHQSADADSTVYYISDVSADGLVAIYNALNWTPGEHVAVKLSTGEPGSNYLRTDLIGDLVQSLPNPTIVESNTAYGGRRANAAMHYQLAADHGYTAIADVNILDENGSMTLPVTGGENLTENYVGANFANYDSYLILSHFKGHSMAGFGGAIKNISIGIASSEGKCWIHSGGTSRTNAWGGEQDAFLESMAEAGKSVADSLDDKIVYINVMNRLSVDCDCDGNPAEPDMHDIGILASYDPVALDQACVDLVYAVQDGGSLIRRMESRNGLHTLEHGEGIGLGSRSYSLVSLDN